MTTRECGCIAGHSSYCAIGLDAADFFKCDKAIVSMNRTISLERTLELELKLVLIV